MTCTVNPDFWPVGDSLVSATITDGDDAPVTTGTVSLQFFTTAGTSIGDALSLTHTSGGIWTVTIPDDHPLTVGSQYFARITVASGGNTVTFQSSTQPYRYRGW